MQKHLGHASPSITLNIYTHLFDTDDDVWDDGLASPQQVPEVIDLNAKRASDQGF